MLDTLFQKKNKAMKNHSLIEKVYSYEEGEIFIGIVKYICDI